jgi:hydrogenase maturation protein HypF
MASYHIHIKGIVQGVGFRPHIYRLAKSMGILGTVNNNADGVHILATAEEEKLKKFFRFIINDPPPNALITFHQAELIKPLHFEDFHIIHSQSDHQPDLMITPDFGICHDCSRELFDKTSRRFHYPFITCTNCGPRYSIITNLPYDRESTTMDAFEQCYRCRAEYFDPANRRYYSQSNSCPDCGIEMFFVML